MEAANRIYIKKPENDDSLVELKEFPGYFLDMEHFKVWSFLSRGYNKKKTWRCLSVKPSGALQLMTNNRLYSVRIGRLVASIMYGVSYNSLPKYYCFNIKDGILSKETKTQSNRNNHFRKIKHINESRTEDLRRAIRLMELLLNAYEGGDVAPLIECVMEGKEKYFGIVKARGGWSKELLQEAFDWALDKLMDSVVYNNKRMYDIDWWICNRMSEYLLSRPPHISWEEWMNKNVIKQQR